MPCNQLQPSPLQGGSTAAASEPEVLLLTTRVARPSPSIPSLAVLFAAVTAGLAIVTAMVWTTRSDRPAMAGGSQSVGRVALSPIGADVSVIFSTDVMPLSPEEAQNINDERPVDVRKVEPARPFRVVADDRTQFQFGEGVRCLTQAIYYEAAGEPEEGQRAVAQVILNRLRHPAFPNTICGVVYQGSERRTGCQFTFTCDGSLAQVPGPAAFARAERVARQALAGRVVTAVGNATNYHADYVVPYWAPTLNKVTKIGSHIFYGLRGALGFQSAFRGSYDLATEGLDPGLSEAVAAIAGTERADLLQELSGLLPATKTSLLEADEKAGQLLPGALPPGDTEARPILQADRDRGELMVRGSRICDPPAERVIADRPSPAQTE